MHGYSAVDLAGIQHFFHLLMKVFPLDQDSLKSLHLGNFHGFFYIILAMFAAF